MQYKLSEVEQVEFDLRIKEIKLSAARNKTLSQNEGNVKHYTNWLELIHYNKEKFAAVKCPKKLTHLLYYLESARRITRKTHANFKTLNNKAQTEYNIIDFLHNNMINVPEPIYTSVDGVVITEFLPHNSSVIDLNKEEHELFLQNLSITLSNIHEYGMHGEFTVQNFFQHNKIAYAVDFERFVFTSNPHLLVQDLKRLIGSVASNTIRKIADVEQIVINSYEHPNVKNLYFQMKRKN